ncbi:MAG: HupE/UreJ family protein [Parvibaculaceae bacterium]
MKRHCGGFLLLALVLFTPTIAHAHFVNSGLGPFYDGALNLLLSPLDIVRLVALCLFMGAQGQGPARNLVIVAFISWFATATSALSVGATAPFEVTNAVSLFLLGGAVAFDLKPRPLVAGMVAAGFAGLSGVQSGIELRSHDADWVSLLGAAAVAAAIMLLATALVVSATKFPVRVACRVLGSWMSATGLLSIGWIVAANR